MIYQLSHNLINQHLKRNRDVDKFKRHNRIFKVIITYTERHHPLISFIYFNLIIRIFKIEFNKV